MGGGLPLRGGVFLASPTESAAAGPSLWRRRAFVAVYTGSAVSILGDGLYLIALPWWVLQITGSTTAMASVSAMETLTQVVSAPFLGTLSDRLNRRWAMVAMDLARAALVLIPALLVLGQRGNLAAVLAVAAGLSLCSGLFNPAFNASMLDIAGRENLLQANAIQSTTRQLGQFVAISLGGTVVALIGAAGAMFADSVSFLASAVAILAAGAFARAPARRQNTFWQDLKEGLAYVRHTPVILGLMVTGTFLNFVATPLMVYFAPLARSLGAGAQGYGWLLGSTMLGFTAGAVVAPPVAKRVPFRQGYLGCLGITLAGLAAIALGFASSLPVAIAMGVLLGFGISWPNVLLPVGLQSMVPQALQGRVGSLLGTVLAALQPAAYLLGGVLADRFPLGTLIALSGLLTTLFSLAFYLVPGLRDIG